MKTLTKAVRCDKEFRQLSITFEEQFHTPNPLPIVVNGLPIGATEAFASELFRDGILGKKRNALVLLPEEREALEFASFLTAAGIPAYYYPKRDFVTYPVTASHDLERERLSVLQKLLAGGCVAVSTPGAAMQYTMPRAVLSESGILLSPGSVITPENLAFRLLNMGFSQVETVEGMGQFARRGGIVDLFSPGEDYPVRIEFFGDEVDRMGAFDPMTQRVFRQTEKLSLLPAKEVLTDKASREKIKKAASQMLAKTEREASRDALTREINAIENGLDIAFADKYITLVYPEPETLLTYVKGDTRPAIAVIGTSAVKQALDASVTASSAETQALLDDGVLAGKFAMFSAEKYEYDVALNASVTVHLNTFSDSTGSMRLSGLFGIRCRRTAFYGDNMSLLIEDLTHFEETGYRVMIAAENQAEADALAVALRDRNFAPVPADPDTFDWDTLPYGGVAITPVRLPDGFELMNARVAVITMSQENASRTVRKKTPRRILKRAGAGERILSYAELTVGDYVVHDTHGIGIYEGINTITSGGVTRDYVTVAYAGNDKIHIPTDSLGSISKYIGARSEDGSVKLSKLGGTEWYHAKQKAKAAAKDIAKDLIRLYATRQRRAGFAFPPDSDLEREFDNAFEFEETAPQLAAIEEIKADMMRPCPMDRLLCGDVGFGKTEVAFRAVFKAIAAGKQAAILAPTTILALQHYETALSRFRGYPVVIDMLSSFRTPKEKERILRRVGRGETSLVIGTHALLSKNVKFQDLGLLVIDEEQRFGVAQKEKLKQMALDVDVLTLSATPIPRTLNMAMSGIRDMSILDEAPLDRHPVQTYVMEHDDAVITDAIRRELRRAGQVLYLYNRVETIDLCAGKLQKAVPEARIAYAHGKMDKDDLEDIWQSLVRGDIDVLVCTTIIETGVDLPNANTLIIEDADRMGLSQLHQIRGRVGRSGRHAYAYFTYRRGKTLSDIAQKRLSAIRDYAEFGAGFRIALRDLEIRGAGNLLGAEQHGHIDAVGYDMYVRLMNEAIIEEKGGKAEVPFETKMDMAIDALIPVSYIGSPSLRMDMYKKISLIRTKEDKSDVMDEFCDRFGEPPTVTLRLLNISLARAAASKAHIGRVELIGKELRFFCEKIDLATWSELFAANKGLAFSGGTRPYVFYRVPKEKDPTEVASDILTRYASLLSENSDAKETEKENSHG